MRALLDRLSGTAPAVSASIVRSRLFIKYVILFVAVVGLALVANGAFAIYFSYQEQKTSLVRIQREQAEAAAGKIGQFVSEIERQVGWTTQLPWSAGTLEQRRFDALRLLRQVPAITELAEIDSTGHEQLKVSRLAMEVVGSGNDISKDPAFIEAVAHKVYYGPVYFRRESEPYMTLSLAGTRRDTGVSVPGGTCTHWKAPPCHGAHPDADFVVAWLWQIEFLHTKSAASFWNRHCAHLRHGNPAKFDKSGDRRPGCGFNMPKTSPAGCILVEAIYQALRPEGYRICRLETARPGHHCVRAGRPDQDDDSLCCHTLQASILAVPGVRFRLEPNDFTFGQSRSALLSLLVLPGEPDS
jgi:hypothetical protein